MCLYAGTSAGASTASVRIFAPHNIYIYMYRVCVCVFSLLLLFDLITSLWPANNVGKIHPACFTAGISLIEKLLAQ